MNVDEYSERYILRLSTDELKKVYRTKPKEYSDDEIKIVEEELIKRGALLINDIKPNKTLNKIFNYPSIKWNYNKCFIYGALINIFIYDKLQRWSLQNEYFSVLGYFSIGLTFILFLPIIREIITIDIDFIPAIILGHIVFFGLCAIVYSLYLLFIDSNPPVTFLRLIFGSIIVGHTAGAIINFKTFKQSNSESDYQYIYRCLTNAIYIP